MLEISILLLKSLFLSVGWHMVAWLLADWFRMHLYLFSTVKEGVSLQSFKKPVLQGTGVEEENLWFLYCVLDILFVSADKYMQVNRIYLENFQRHVLNATRERTGLFGWEYKFNLVSCYTENLRPNILCVKLFRAISGFTSLAHLPSWASRVRNLSPIDIRMVEKQGNKLQGQTTKILCPDKRSH